MRSVSRPLALLHPDPTFRDLLRVAASEEYDITVVESWAELEEVVQSASPAVLIVVSGADSAAEEPAVVLWDLLREFPSATVIAVLDPVQQRARHVEALGSWGVAEVISRESEDTPAAIAQRLAVASMRRPQRLLAKFFPVSNARARMIVLRAFDLVAVGGHGADLADAMGVTRRTILRWCESAGLPTPRRLMVWMRALLAAEMLDDPGRRIASIARLCGYTNDNALRTALTNLVGKSPRELRRIGAVQTISELFTAELRNGRIARRR